MTGGATRSFERTGESSPGWGLRRSARSRPAHYGRTSRNAFQGRTAAPSRASHAECGRLLTILDSTLVAMTDAMDVSDLEFSWPPQHGWRRDALSARPGVPGRAGRALRG